MITIIFYILAAITLGTGVMTVLSRNPIHSAVYMILCFLSISGHMLLLDAQFLAIINIVVYAGAIVVLVLFTLMLMNLGEQHEPKKKLISRFAAILSVGLVCLVLLAVIVKSVPVIEYYKSASLEFQSVQVIGQVLLDEYLVPFEFASVLLITAMIGAIMISKKEKTA